jgi:hypothetical protein
MRRRGGLFRYEGLLNLLFPLAMLLVGIIAALVVTYVK